MMNKKFKGLWQEFRDWLFEPPYYGVPYAVWLYAFGTLFVFLHGNGVLTGHLIGFDDHVRMTQVLNWINGAGWYDRTITRTNAPDGFHTIWTRIVDIPIAFVVLIAQQFVSQRAAALVAAVVVPYTELAIAFIAAIYFVRPLVGKQKARLIPLFLVFTSLLNLKRYTIAGFFPGQASHHAWYVILDMLLFGAAVRIILLPRSTKPILMAALAIAILLAVGIEGFPVIGGTTMILSLIAWWFRDADLANRAAQAFGAGAVLTLLMLPMNMPPARLLEVSFAEPSILGPIMVGAAALFLALEIFILRVTAPRRILSFISLAILAGLFAFALVTAFPDIKSGPGAALSPAERAMAHQQHPESWTMLRVTDSATQYIGLVVPALVALIAGVVAMVRAPSRRLRMMYASYFGFAALTEMLAQALWRYIHHAMTATCAWLFWVWERGKKAMAKNRHYGLFAFLLFIALCPFWMLLLPAIEDDLPFMSQVLFFPAKVQNTQDLCDVLGFARYLNEHYGTNTNIIVPEWDSDKFIYHTHLHVDFLSNYPSGDKFIDNLRFFRTDNPDEAKDVARRHQIDLVGVCLSIPLAPASILNRAQRKPIFIETLVQGTPPDWLKPVQMPLLTNYRLFQVDKAGLAR